MALNTQLSDTVANAAADAAADLADNGYIRVYDGTQPANANTAVSTQVLLAELRFGSTAFGAAAAGVKTANAITPDSSANATGTATWFRVLKSDGTTVLWDGSVAASSANLNMSPSIVAGQVVSISSYTYTQPEA